MLWQKKSQLSSVQTRAVMNRSYSPRLLCVCLVSMQMYRWHTGYPGGLKERPANDQLTRKPEEVITCYFCAAHGKLARVQCSPPAFVTVHFVFLFGAIC